MTVHTFYIDIENPPDNINYLMSKVKQYLLDILNEETKFQGKHKVRVSDSYNEDIA